MTVYEGYEPYIFLSYAHKNSASFLWKMRYTTQDICKGISKESKR